MSIYQPYTYLIEWSSTGMKYYGVRYAKNCNPKEFWKSYFTSSKYVKQYRKLHGEPDIISIRKTFVNRDDAILWEYKFLNRINAGERNDFLNVCNTWRVAADRVFSDEHRERISKSLVGKTSKQKREQALYASECARIKNTGRKRPEHSRKMKLLYKEGKVKPPVLKGKDHPNYGGLKEETKKKLSEVSKYRPRVCCLKCHKSIDDTVSEGIWTCHFSTHHKNC